MGNSIMERLAAQPRRFIRFVYYHFALRHWQTKLLNHSVAQSYLTGANVSFNGNPISPYDVFIAGNLELDSRDFVLLFSIFNGSDFHFQSINNVTAEQAPVGTYVVVDNSALILPGYQNRTGVYPSKSSRSLHLDALHIDHFILTNTNRPQKMATVAFALCAITAFQAGFSEITLLAAGGPGFDPMWEGSKVWPKFGFDAPLEELEKRLRQFKKCKTVQDLIEVDEAWWLHHGVGRLMSFRLSPGSRSWKILLRYLQSRL